MLLNISVQHKIDKKNIIKYLHSIIILSKLFILKVISDPQVKHNKMKQKIDHSTLGEISQVKSWNNIINNNKTYVMPNLS